MTRMTSNKAIDIVMSKGYDSTTPHISYDDAMAICDEYEENTFFMWDSCEARKNPNYRGELAFFNKTRTVHRYAVANN